MAVESKDETKEETPPGAEHVPTTPDPTHDNKSPVTSNEDSTVRDTVSRLEAAVNTLTAQVATLLESGRPTTDTSPVKPPWTHRKWGRSA